MRRQCDICGAESDEYWMVPISTGSKTEWWCAKCYQNADKEAEQSDLIRGYKLHKISESKKRNK